MLSGDQRFHLSRGPVRIVNSWWPDLKRFQCISGSRKDIKEEIKPWNNLMMHAAGFPTCTVKRHARTSLKCSHVRLNSLNRSAKLQKDKNKENKLPSSAFIVGTRQREITVVSLNAWQHRNKRC